MSFIGLSAPHPYGAHLKTVHIKLIRIGCLCVNVVCTQVYSKSLMYLCEFKENACLKTLKIIKPYSNQCIYKPPYKPQGNLWAITENMLFSISYYTYSHDNHESRDEGKDKDLCICQRPVKASVKNQ